MVGGYHRLNGHEFGQTPGDSGQGSLACCSPWSFRVGHDLVTEHNTDFYYTVLGELCDLSEVEHSLVFISSTF